MAMRIHDWMDNWFLALSEDPDRLDKAIRNQEAARMVCAIGFFITLAMFLLVVFKSTNPGQHAFMFGIVLLLMVVNLHADIYTKILKLQRQNQKKGGA